MTVLWSLVNPDYPWSFPSLFPEKLSWAQWKYVFKYTNILRALKTSYAIAPFAVPAFLRPLAADRLCPRPEENPWEEILHDDRPSAHHHAGHGRRPLPEPRIPEFRAGQSFFGLVLAHTLMGLPYMIRVLTTSFEAIPQDVIDAAENLGAGTFAKIRDIFLPMVRPGLLAGMVFAFTTSIEEFNLTFIIGTPTFETIPTILYSFLGYNFVRTNASVVALIMMIPNIVMLFAVERILKSDYLSASLGKL